MGNLAFGTSYFINIRSAIRYYENMGFSEADVRDKLIEGEIHIGKPEAWAGHYLRVDEDGRFQQVRTNEYEEIAEEIMSEARSWRDNLREENPHALFEMYRERERLKTFQLPDTGWDSLMNTIEDNEANEALKEANKAMDKRTTKILDWIYDAQEVMLIINGVMLFGIVCYLMLWPILR